MISGKLSALLCALALVHAASSAAGQEVRPQLWFPVGEKLTYRVYWGILPVAQTVVSSEWIEEDGSLRIAIRARTKSFSLLDAIYPVDDFIESIVEPATFTPLRFSKRLSEGRYRLNEITTFDHDDRMARWNHLIRGDVSYFEIEEDTRDLLSFMYYMRSQKFEPNRVYNYRVMADEKIYDLVVNTRDYRELSMSKFGRRRCLYIEPEALFQGLFIRIGRLHVWISDDERRLCARAVAEAPIIGSIKLVLDKVEGPGHDSWQAEDSAQPGGSGLK